MPDTVILQPFFRVGHALLQALPVGFDAHGVHAPHQRAVQRCAPAAQGIEDRRRGRCPLTARGQGQIDHQLGEIGVGFAFVFQYFRHVGGQKRGGSWPVDGAKQAVFERRRHIQAGKPAEKRLPVGGQGR